MTSSFGILQLSQGDTASVYQTVITVSKTVYNQMEHCEVQIEIILKIPLAIRGFLFFHTNCEIICSSSVKNIVGSLIGITLNL